MWFSTLCTSYVLLYNVFSTPRFYLNNCNLIWHFCVYLQFFVAVFFCFVGSNEWYYLRPNANVIEFVFLFRKNANDFTILAWCLAFHSSYGLQAHEFIHSCVALVHFDIGLKRSSRKYWCWSTYISLGSFLISLWINFIIFSNHFWEHFLSFTRKKFSEQRRLPEILFEFHWRIFPKKKRQSNKLFLAIICII